VPLPTGLRALANRDFRVYYAGNLIAQTGSWMQTVSQSWLVLQLTDSPFLLGLIATLQSGPILLLAVFTGVLADRLTKRNISVAPARAERLASAWWAMARSISPRGSRSRERSGRSIRSAVDNSRRSTRRGVGPALAGSSRGSLAGARRLASSSPSPSPRPRGSLAPEHHDLRNR
jgi:hypothetical protein